MALFGGIETGGTKIVCAVGRGTEVLAETRFPTGENPRTVIERCKAFFTEQSAEEPLAALGVASFGPCDPDPASPTFGWITSTPKPGWRDTDLVTGLRHALPGIPIAFDTDVNGAAWGEARHGAGKGKSDLIYLTIGTGIGGGGIVSGKLIHGLMHPEMGHILVPRSEAERVLFHGVCPYHGDCWEGIASGPAMAARWGEPAQELPDDHPAWELEAEIVAAGLHTLTCTLSPQLLILGGGVGSNPNLLERVRPRLRESLAGYISKPEIIEDIDSFVVPPELGGEAGVVGALTMAEDLTVDT